MNRPSRLRRVDDATAQLDALLAHTSLAIAIAIALVALTVHSMRGALVGAAVIGVVSAYRLWRHPLRMASLSRVYIDGPRVLVATPLGSPKPVDVASVKHEQHSPWPCALELVDGTSINFVARRDDGSTAFFDLELSDRKRYERPSDARDSITTVEMAVRSSQPPRSLCE